MGYLGFFSPKDKLNWVLTFIVLSRIAAEFSQILVLIGNKSLLIVITVVNCDKTLS